MALEAGMSVLEAGMSVLSSARAFADLRRFLLLSDAADVARINVCLLRHSDDGKDKHFGK